MNQIFRKALPLLYGRTVWSRSSTGDLEYGRKAALLFTVQCLAFVMLPLFGAISFCRGDHYHALINAAVLVLLFGTYLHMRFSGILQVNAILVLSLLSAQFVSDFASDTYRAMWSYTIPVLCFFLLGTRRGLLYAAVFFAVLAGFMWWGPPSAYPMDFRLRFIAIYTCISIFSYFFEQTRCDIQRLLHRSRMLTETQRRIGTLLAAGHDFTVLQRALEIAVRIPPFDCGGVYIIDPSHRDLRLVAHTGLPPEFLAVTSHYAADDPHTTLVLTGVPRYTLYPSVGVPIRHAEPLRAIAVVPLKSGDGVVVGALNAASHTGDDIPADVRAAIEMIAADMGTAVVRIHAAEQLRELSARNEAILAAVPDIIMQVDQNKIYTWANQAGYDFFGNDVIGKEAAHYFVGEQDTYAKVEPLFSGRCEAVSVESWQRRNDGEVRLLAWWCRPLRDNAGNVIGALSSARDITDSRLLEQQYSQAQKMEAIGQLAGGIAHDFNNQLGAISGFAELIKRRAEHNEKVRGYADRILLSARRATDLTAKLLAFARKGAHRVVPVDIHEVIAEVVSILKHTIDRRITLVQELNAQPATVLGDPTQLQNALLNLALNARDAMPEGGTVTFRTACRDLDPQYCTSLPYALRPGNYLEIIVADTGCGMSDEVKKHLFEPFFTTKEQGKGTGMGLSAVYGIVKAHNGAISIESEVGKGTQVVIHLPATREPAATPSASAAPHIVSGGTGLRILVIDDETDVREIVREMLEELGHTVTLCEDGAAGIARYREVWRDVDLVFLDMVMPRLSGSETFAALRAINPDVRVLLSSGYSEQGNAQRLLSSGARGFLQKPFSAEQLYRAVEYAMRNT